MLPVLKRLPPQVRCARQMFAWHTNCADSAASSVRAAELDPQSLWEPLLWSAPLTCRSGEDSGLPPEWTASSKSMQKILQSVHMTPQWQTFVPSVGAWVWTAGAIRATDVQRTAFTPCAWHGMAQRFTPQQDFTCLEGKQPLNWARGRLLAVLLVNSSADPLRLKVPSALLSAAMAPPALLALCGAWQRCPAAQVPR
jgi:hypothetical protein